MPDKVRVATVQSNHVPTCDGLKTNPFSDDFSMNDLLQSIERRIAWYEELFDQADQYPPGGVANTPESIAEVYRKHKEARQKILRGEKVPYHWRW